MSDSSMASLARKYKARLTVKSFVCPCLWAADHFIWRNSRGAGFRPVEEVVKALSADVSRDITLNELEPPEASEVTL